MESLTIVRPAEISDIGNLLEFEQGVITAERPFDPTICPEDTFYYNIPQLIVSAKALLVVAEHGGEVVASGYAKKLAAKKCLDHDNYAYVGFMFTAHHMRGKRINLAVMDGLKTWCLQQDLHEIKLDVYENNKPAIRAYEKSGMTKYLKTMRRRISLEDSSNCGKAPNNSAISVRPATLEDVDLLAQFEQGVISAERPIDPTLTPSETTYYNIPELIVSCNVILVVAELNGEVVGCGYAKKLPAKHFNDHEYFAYLGFMYTIQEQRGQGVNSAILTYLKGWCFQQGLFEMRLEVYEDNHVAVRAYEKNGFIKHMVTMRMRL